MKKKFHSHSSFSYIKHDLHVLIILRIIYSSTWMGIGKSNLKNQSNDDS